MADELSIRLGCFFGIFILMAIWEGLAPRRVDPNFRAARWPSNIGIVVLNTLFVRLVFPTTAVGLAIAEGQYGWGLFNIVSLPYWATILISVLLLDLTLYLQHVLFHAVPLLWRLHRMHHADIFFDITTGSALSPI